jgi:hypothetical protein
MCFILCGFGRTALFSGQSERINQRGYGVPLGDFGFQFLADFEGGGREVHVDAGVSVPGQEEADRVVVFVLEYEIGE